MEEFTTLLALIPFNPGILAVVETGKAVSDYLERFRFLSYAYYVSGFYMIRRYVDHCTVNGDMFVKHELASCRTARCYAKTIYYIV